MLKELKINKILFLSFKVWWSSSPTAASTSADTWASRLSTRCSIRQVQKIWEQWKPLNVITDNVIKFFQIDMSQITLLYLLYFLYLFIIWLMLSIKLCPKVITLSGFHCERLPIYNSYNSFLKLSNIPFLI
jgi:hypothetical protein